MKLGWLVVAACGSAAAPTPAPKVVTPAAPVKIEPADLRKLGVGSTSGFEIHFEGSDVSVAEVRKWAADGNRSSRYDVWPWDSEWPGEIDAFEAKLKTSGFIDEKYTWDVKRTSATADTWEFRGIEIRDNIDEKKPAFIMVRTVGSQRFVCLGRRVEDDWAMTEAVASCRSATIGRITNMP
ncbi:MAG: hypothetical protein QM831_21560 [Kofleriaceae bacterium]